MDFEAGPAANNPGPRAVLRRHAPSATRQRTLEANGIDCGAGPVRESSADLALYPIVQERPTNPLKHAHESRVEEDIPQTDDTVEVALADVGRDPRADTRRTWLVGMREPVALNGRAAHAGHRIGGGFESTHIFPSRRDARPARRRSELSWEGVRPILETANEISFAGETVHGFKAVRQARLLEPDAVPCTSGCRARTA